MELQTKLRQSQQLNISQDLKLSLKILEMSNLELNQYIENLIDINPFLEKVEEREEFLGKSGECDEKKSRFFENQVAEKTLIAYLEEQIALEFQNEEVKIARYLCEFLDDKGYFKGNISHIASLLRIDSTQISNILNKLKTFDPIGIFAETIAECLRIQLEEKRLWDPILEIILENLELVASAELKTLAKLCNVGLNEVISRINLIKKLNPKPASIFSSEFLPIIIPDLILSLTEYEFNLELNSDSLPKVLFNEAYYHSLRVEIKDKNDKHYLAQSSREIVDVIRHLKQRSNTLMLVAKEIIEKQIEFFTKGLKYFKPLTINDIAESLGLHPSTISRVTKNKYISTPLGVFELKYFFAKGIDNGSEITANKTVKQEILNIIELEPIDNAYSDDQIASILEKKGYKISRRTVVKYREELSILNSNQRKKQKLLKSI